MSGEKIYIVDLKQAKEMRLISICDDGKVVEIGTSQLKQFFEHIESLAQEAELGRAAAEAIGNKSPYPCQYPLFIDGSSICKMCTWTNFCRLRTESSNLNAEQQPTGIELIAAERQRQIEKEGWTAEHDDQYNSELALAAACYTLPGVYRMLTESLVPRFWPFDDVWWKPTPDNRIRELQKAGALIAAEIDRLQRKGAE